MVQALTNAVEASRAFRPGRRPPNSAMEVATSVLYLEAAFEDLDPHDPPAHRAHRAAGRPHRTRARGRPFRAARAVDGGALPPRQRPPDHGHRGRRAAQPPERAREIARPVSSAARPKRACCAPCRRSCCRCVVCSRCSASTRPRTPCSACARTSTRCWSSTSPADEMAALRRAGQQPGRAGLPDRHAGLPAALAKRLFVFDADAGRTQAADGPPGRRGHCRPTAPASIAGLRPSGRRRRAQRRGSRCADRRQARRAGRARRASAKASPIEEFSRAADSWTAKITGPRR